MRVKIFPIRRRGVPFTAIREVREILDILAVCRRSSCSGREIRELVDMLVEESDVRCRMWLTYLQTMAVDYQQECTGIKQPVQIFIDMVFERSRDFGRFGMETSKGVRVATMHSVKGMEFPVVLLLGYPFPGVSLEEERRLYYVGMTRAKDMLECVYGPAEHVFIPAIASVGPEYVCREDVSVQLDAGEVRTCTGQLWEMEPDDLVLSFPAFRDVDPRTGPMIDRLAGSGTCPALACKPWGKGFCITADNVPVALFSRKGAGIVRKYRDQGYVVERIIPLAQIRRTPSETDLAGDKVDTDRFHLWHVPLFQIVMERGAGL